ncbi:hypothetical protein TNCV_4333451 [Trichonephila clavipes]|nr:hypothetical protein TNCV_4333451 [Trichonephila clavipes]
MPENNEDVNIEGTVRTPKTTHSEGLKAVEASLQYFELQSASEKNYVVKMNKILKTPVGLECPTVSSEVFVVVEDNDMHTAPIIPNKDILEFDKSSKISLMQIPTMTMKRIMQVLFSRHPKGDTT